MAKAKKSAKINLLADNDSIMDEDKRKHQKLKPYLVMECLMQETDEEHPMSSYDIAAYVLDNFGIDAERRSVLDDIREINYLLYMLEHNCDIVEAVEDLDSGDYDDEKYILFESGKDGGYYINKRRHNISEEEIRLLAECVYASRFIDDKTAERLIEIIRTLTNRRLAQSIKHDLPLLSRPRTTNQDVFKNIRKINDAMKWNEIGYHHTPEKITFRYQKHCINDINKTVDRRNGERYKVSPFKLMIDDGRYYLLAFDDKSQEMRTYRVDRMADIRFTGETRDGEEEYKSESMKEYSLHVFGMFAGRRERVTLQFDDCLLDSVIDRFGRKGIMYSHSDDGCFTIKPEIDISDQFFGWLCGFGDKVKILEPDTVRQEFTEFIDRIRSIY